MTQKTEPELHQASREGAAARAPKTTGGDRAWLRAVFAALLLGAAFAGGGLATCTYRALSPGERKPPPTIADAEAAPYPLITHRGEVPMAVRVTGDGASRIIAVAVRPYLEDSTGRFPGSPHWTLFELLGEFRISTA